MSTPSPTSPSPDAESSGHHSFAMATIFFVTAAVIGCVVRPITLRLKSFELTLDFGTAPPLGVLILLITTTIDFATFWHGIKGADGIVPWAILIIFYSLAYLCVSWDMTGLFSYIAKNVLLSAGSDGRRIFFYFFILSSLLTVFTSNDIVILVLTPIICYIANYTGMNPIPYLISQFFAANIWSIFLVIGNPTNIIVAEAYRMKFLEYTAWMAIPTATAGFTALALMYFIFRSQLPTNLEIPQMAPPTIYDKTGAIVATCTMAICLSVLILTQWISVPLWTVCMCAGAVMFSYDFGRDSYNFITRTRYRNGYTQINTEPDVEAPKVSHSRADGAPRSAHSSKKALEAAQTKVVVEEEPMDYWNKPFGKMQEVLSRLPWKILPFVVSMFVTVEGLNKTGWVGLIAGAFSKMINNSTGGGIFVIGVLSTLACSFINNQPMTILFTHILKHENYVADDITKMASQFALIIGSNFGANITLVGALAGLMWHKILSDNKIKNINYFVFMKHGLMIMPFVMLNTFLVMYVEYIVVFFDELQHKVEQHYLIP